MAYVPDEKGLEFLVHLELPPGERPLVQQLHPHCYGLHLDDGAKPWPYYQDAETGEWWSMNSPSEVKVSAALWAIDLKQLSFRPRDEARAWLATVLTDLEAAAARAGGRARPERTVEEALRKMDNGLKADALREAEILIRVAAPAGGAYTIEQWWNALEAAGFSWGDGDLFWLPLVPEAPTESEEDVWEDCPELCAEPYTVQGYFHPGDRGGAVVLPDIALRVQVRGLAEPESALQRVEKVAENLARHLGARLLSEDGSEYSSDAMRRWLAGVTRAQAAL